MPGRLLRSDPALLRRLEIQCHVAPGVPQPGPRADVLFEARGVVGIGGVNTASERDRREVHALLQGVAIDLAEDHIERCAGFGGELDRAPVARSEEGRLAAAAAALAAIGAALDRALEDSDADLDWSLVDGILEIACEDGSKVIVNRHAPNREIWVAARSGGFHFRADGGRWRDSRGGGELGSSLAAILREQAGLAVAFGDLAASG